MSFWGSVNLWKESAYNTMWCLIGCSIGDLGTIAFFQFTHYSLPTFYILTLAIINGLITSILLETFILSKKGMSFSNALRTAFGMSFISMISMEIAMNVTDYHLTGEAKLVWWVIPIMLLAGFLTAWPYNYWRLKKFGQSCCH